MHLPRVSFLAVCLIAAGALGEPVRFESSDGIAIHGDLLLGEQAKDGPLVMLFHQGGSNARGEYGDVIAPRLVKEGYSVLMIDARAGGSHLGSQNRTIDALADGSPRYSYGDAYPDIVATLAYAREQGFNGPTFAWGSSYSGALVMKLAIDQADELAGVLGFSPASGDAMGEWASYNFAGDVKVPTLVAWPQSEWERSTVQRTRTLAAEDGHEIYLQPQGVHGSSMLHPSRASGGTEELWERVLIFLKEKAQAANETTSEPVPES